MQRAQTGGATGLLWELGGDVLCFPAWWYGKGLISALQYTLSFIQGYARTLGVMTWVKNIFTPMFGRYDWQSRIISVFMRLANVFARGFATMIVAIIAVAVFCVYIVLPIASISFMLFHATAVFAL